MFKKSPLVLLLSMASFNSFAAECGSVTIADMNLGSATLVANIDAFILANGYGCDVEIVPGNSTITATSMIEKNTPDIAPEFWTNQIRATLEKGGEEGRIVVAGDLLSDGAVSGFWVPAYMVEKDPSLATLAGIKANAKLFKHPEDPSRSAFMACPAGWTCQISTTNLYKAMDLADYGFDLVDPGSGAGLSGSMVKAYENKEAWFGYYWSPTAIMDKYDMVRVDFGTGFNRDEFENCTIIEECEDPKVTDYPAAPVQSIVTSSFSKREPEVMQYLGKRSFTNAQMNQQLAWIDEEQADGDYAAENFLLNNKAMWSQWVTQDVALKIDAALADL
ncbi:ABC transporter substrate-binding protein [Moritella sp. 24]|uniref:ABC transporter substrate-binding protein n=1 Tax=Moritella sp. 24 TaxID=2746230 RepID=UPI001BA9132F|nr:ABC transporter substrate-binding protein [Moritella sp. 24]QUM76265.1 ABC transporter substrate-binding protein [Moritella sp. 24]